MFSLDRSYTIAAYKKELSALIGFVACLFIAVSLYSFSSTDPSMFFISSKQLSTKNLCGFVGAHIASILFFLFGAAAYLVVPLLGFCFYSFIFKNIRYEWERLVFGLFFLVALSALAYVHMVTINASVSGGGYFGFICASYLLTFFDRVGSLLLLYTAASSSFIMLFRFSFMHSLHYAIAAVSQALSVLAYYRIPQKIVYSVGYLSGLIIWPFMQIGYFGMKLLDGSAFDGTGLLKDEDDEVDPQFSFNRNKTITVMPNERVSDSVQPEVSQNVSFLQKSFSDKSGDLGIETREQAGHQEVIASRSASYGLPDLDIFIGDKEKRDDADFKKQLEQRAEILAEKLERFGVYGSIVSIKSGPVVTLFEYQPDIDTKLSKILALEDDLALALQALSIRILAPIPGRSVVGFEVANKDRKDVLLAQVVQSPEYQDFSGSLPLVLGKDTIGQNMVVDLAKMPHLLIAGSTGSGKSIALNAMLTSLLCKCTPQELKLILIDPKRLEFASYADIAHLLFPIITDPKKSVPILRWIVNQMEERYEKMSKYGARNIYDYNTLASQAGDEQFPFIVVVIDELSDLMLTVGREIEDVILRITQMARAAGIHMIVATQRPSVDVITGLIKVNFPSRISFRVTSRVDSRTILDCGGADKLLGRGDMLFLDSTASVLKRVHGAYVSDQEINSVVSHIKSQQKVDYLDVNDQLSSDQSDASEQDEELYKQVVTYLDDIEEVSISLLQRKFRIGYNRSARIIDMLESRGLIMPADGGKTRRVIR